MTDPLPSPRPPVDRILALRGIACVLVLLNHVVGKLTESFDPGSSWSWLTPFLVPVGFPCVWLFFVLSSFLLTTAFLGERFSLDRPGTRYFYRTRALRLLPLFALIQGALFLMAALHLSKFLHKSSPVREISILLAAPWGPYFERTQAVQSLNSPVWSVILEFHFIALLPLTIPLLRRTRMLHVTLIAAWAGACVLYGVRGWDIFPGFYQQHLYNFGFLALGQILAWTKFRLAPDVKRPLLPALAFLVLAWLILQHQAAARLQQTLAWGPLLFAPALWFFLVRLDTAYQKKLPTSYREIGSRLKQGLWLETLGAMSYSIYLCHKPLAYALILGLGLTSRVAGWGALVGFVAAVSLLLLLVSTVLYVEIENRFRFRRQADD